MGPTEYRSLKPRLDLMRCSSGFQADPEMVIGIPSAQTCATVASLGEEFAANVLPLPLRIAASYRLAQCDCGSSGGCHGYRH